MMQFAILLLLFIFVPQVFWGVIILIAAVWVGATLIYLWPLTLAIALYLGVVYA